MAGYQLTFLVDIHSVNAKQNRDFYAAKTRRNRVPVFVHDGPAAFWLSIFPLTSPVIMMIRIPFGVPYFDLFLSMSLLILGFLGATWLAAKIYRTGILMYGKKISYKELWKWIKYK